MKTFLALTIGFIYMLVLCCLLVIFLSPMLGIGVWTVREGVGYMTDIPASFRAASLALFIVLSAGGFYFLRQRGSRLN